jgi:hypothetical protein
MRPVVLEFIGGAWDGKCLRTDSSDREEALLAAECYEMSHHGLVGATCAGFSVDAAAYARDHFWPLQDGVSWHEQYRYRVVERHETENEIVVLFRSW